MRGKGLRLRQAWIIHHTYLVEILWYVVSVVLSFLNHKLQIIKKERKFVSHLEINVNNNNAVLRHIPTDHEYRSASLPTPRLTSWLGPWSPWLIWSSVRKALSWPHKPTLSSRQVRGRFFRCCRHHQRYHHLESQTQWQETIHSRWRGWIMRGEGLGLGTDGPSWP